MGFSCGIVGLPNVGKSTLFNALTTSHVPAENFPFCTKEKNVGIVSVPDQRLQQLAPFAPSARIVPTTMEFVDIAGLVEGASKGEGLGNQFLGHVAEVEAIAHVVRCFEKDDIVHVYGRVDPIRDIEVINTELILRDMDLLQKWLSRNEKAAKSGADKKLRETVALIAKFAESLNQGIPIREVPLSAEEALAAGELHVGTLTSKPLFYVANVSEDDLKNPSDRVKKLKEWCLARKSPLVTISSQVEAELCDLPEEERRAFMKALGMPVSGLEQLIKTGYEFLGLITFFTFGDKEIRAWTIPKGIQAPQAGGKIHSDFERGFIAAETTSFDDFIKSGGEQQARAQGKVRLEGKNYTVQDGDIITFRFNV